MHYQGETSSFQPMNVGVPQGTILGPLLFIIYFNDVVDCIRYSKIIKYADDTVLYIGSNNFTIIETQLNADMSSLESWCRENESILNLEKGKTELLVFGTNQKLCRLKQPLKV